MGKIITLVNKQCSLGVTGMIITGIATLLPNIISGILFGISWIIISVPIYRSLLLLNKSKNYQIIVKTFLVILVAAAFCSFWIYFRPAKQKQEITIEQIQQIVEENNNKKLTKELSENLELKNQANQLSNEILQFLSDRNDNVPKLPSIDISGIMPSKNGMADKNSVAFKRYLEERERQYQITGAYYQETQNEFIKRYGVRYQNTLSDLARHGVALKVNDNFFAAQTNPITMQRAAMRLSELAERLPDTK